MGRNNPDTKRYLKTVALFDSTATLTEVQDAWVSGPPPQQGPALYENAISGYLNATYDSPTVLTNKHKITQLSNGQFEVYNKITFGGTPKVGIPEIAHKNRKDGTMNALKGVYNAKFTPPPVQLTNLTYHTHRSFGDLDAELLGTTFMSYGIDAVLV